MLVGHDLQHMIGPQYTNYVWAVHGLYYFVVLQATS